MPAHETLLRDLAAPFPPDKVSWRIGAMTPDKTKGLALAYIDARDVQDRLDAVCDVWWQCRHHNCGDRLLGCEIGIEVDGEWLWRGDGAGDIEVFNEGPRKEQELDMARKAAFSDAFKRAAVRWGIGRYLYDVEAPWVALEPRGHSWVIAADELNKLHRLLPGTAAPARSSKQKPEPPSPVERLIAAAEEGMLSYETLYNAIGREARITLGTTRHQLLKSRAMDVDAARAADRDRSDMIDSVRMGTYD